MQFVEPEPSLGNGGLGRLAACFLDSIASLGLPGDGIGLNYHFGLFKQVFEDNLQTAEKNEWIEKQSWLTKTDTTYTVMFGKKKVKSRLYDIDVVGYENGINKLHLFDIESVDGNPKSRLPDAPGRRFPEKAPARFPLFPPGSCPWPPVSPPSLHIPVG